MRQTLMSWCVREEGWRRLQAVVPFPAEIEDQWAAAVTRAVECQLALRRYPALDNERRITVRLAGGETKSHHTRRWL